MQQNGVTTEDYQGPVYCFNVSTGFYATMRNGKDSVPRQYLHRRGEERFQSKRGRGVGEGVKSKSKNIFYLGGGDDMACKTEKDGKLLFTFGGKVQTGEEFNKRVKARFGKSFPSAWKEALTYVKGFDEETLLSTDEFFQMVYKPVRDEWSEKWSDATG